MTGGRNDTKIVKATIGERIKTAREDKHLSRKRLTEQLNKLSDRPTINGKQEEMSEDRLKTWEYGTNTINIEWIPLFCEVLDCDVGYLFGEYTEKKRGFSDAHKTTGLSEKAVECLHSISRQVEPVGAYRVIQPKYTHSRITVRVLMLLDRLITSEQFEDLFCELGFYFIDGGLLPDDVFNQNPIELSRSELDKFYDWMEYRGEKLTSRKEISEMHLQTAADMFKNVFREILKEELNKRG